MKKLLILFSLIIISGCANLTKHNANAVINNKGLVNQSQVLSLKKSDVKSPEYVYAHEVRTNMPVKLPESDNTIQNTNSKSNTRTVTKALNSSKVYTPEFDVSALFGDKTLRLNYQSGDNASKEIEEEYDVPVKINDRVLKYIDRFTKSSKNTMQRWITNSYKYLFFIKDVFKQNGLPTDLAYLPLAESGFDVKVRSRAGAVGMWQFMEQTGRLYGLHVDYWVDERRDFEKSTYAAARHLKDLYDRFKDWNLALAAYNAGAGRIQKAIDRFNTDDYFELTGYSNLAEETKDYVPKYIALMMIHKNLPYYGFEYPEVEPVAYEKVKIDFPVNLYVLSKIVGLELDTLINLNPSLRRWITPPNSTFELKVPIGFKEKIESALNEYSHEELLQVRIYVPNRKEKVVTIAKKYNVSPAQIMAINGFRKGIVKAGFPVIVPSEKGNIVVSPRQQQAIAKSISGAGFESDEKSRISSYKIYTVKKGDTLSSIAKKNKTTVSAIKSLNKIKVLKTGLKLKVPDKYITAQKLSSRNKIKTTVPAKKHFISYKVKRGDTIWKLADQYNTQPKEIIKINNIKNLKPGQTIIIPKSKI